MQGFTVLTTLWALWFFKGSMGSMVLQRFYGLYGSSKVLWALWFFKGSMGSMSLLHIALCITIGCIDVYNVVLICQSKMSI